MLWSAGGHWGVLVRKPLILLSLVCWRALNCELGGGVGGGGVVPL